MTDEEFMEGARRRLAEGIPDGTPVFEWVKRFGGGPADYDKVCQRCGAVVQASLTHSKWHADIEDAFLLAELQRRVANDNGVRHSLDDVIARSGITREELDALREEFDTTDQSDAIENGTVVEDDDEDETADDNGSGS